MLQPKTLSRLLTYTVRQQDRSRLSKIIIRLWHLLERIFLPPSVMAEVYSIQPSYFSLDLYRHYWQRLHTFLSYKTESIQNQHLDQQRWQSDSDRQPAITTHKTKLYQWLTNRIA